MIPDLPECALRDAIASEDWTRATEILAEHSQRVHLSLERQPDDIPKEDWDALVARQKAFMSELVTSRDQVAAALERITRQRLGAIAYRNGAKR